MPNLDIKVAPDLQALFDLPPCTEIRLPKPKKLKISLPLGGKIQAFSDISKGIPNDCALTFSLLIQLAPFLASIDCLVKVLKLIKPLVDVVNNITNPVKLPGAVVEFGKAAAPVIDCFMSLTPLGLAQFVRDLLCLIIKVLHCLVDQLKSIIGVLSGLSLQLNVARSEGNTELIAALECARENAETQAAHLTSSMEPIAVIMDVAGTFLQLAGQEPIKLPAIGSDVDVESLNETVMTLQGVLGTLQIVVDGLGGCENG